MQGRIVPGVPCETNNQVSGMGLEDSMTFGEGLKQWRLEQGFSQKTLARMLGCGAVTVWRWESDIAKPGRHAYKLAQLGYQ